MTHDEDARDKVEVEELTLDDLRGPEDRAESTSKGKGGLRAGGLGPEGSRYRPPDAPRRSTWKPTAIALCLLVGAFYGVFTIGYQVTLEDRAEGNTYDLWGKVLDYDDAVDREETPIEGVTVTVDGVDATDVSDDEGKFFIGDIPGGKFTIRFFKRTWNEAVNTVYTSILYTDVPKGSAASFLVEVENLSPDRDRPVYEGAHGVLAEVMDWPTDRQVTIRLHTTAFDEDLSAFTVQMGEPGDTLFDMGGYANLYHYNFSQNGDQSNLTIKVLDDNGTVHAQTTLAIPDHPLGPGGWETKAFPDVAAFVRGGQFTDGEDRTIAIHSNAAAEYTYRVDGGAWQGWSAMTDGHAEHVWSPGSVVEGDHQVEVMVRNATGVNGSKDAVVITLDETPPTLEPTSTRGAAVTDQATFNPGTEDAWFIRYSLPDGTWSEWQLKTDEVLVPIDDSDSEATVIFEGMDKAGNTASANGVVEVKRQKVSEVDDHAGYYNNLKLCLPIQGIGIILAGFGALMAYRRQRPTMVMLGAMGALLAGFGIIGAIIAAAALVLVMMSREEFEMPGPAPER